MQVTIVSSACVLCLIAYLFLSNRSVYLVNFSCYKPPAAYVPSCSAYNLLWCMYMASAVCSPALFACFKFGNGLCDVQCHLPYSSCCTDSVHAMQCQNRYHHIHGRVYILQGAGLEHACPLTGTCVRVVPR